MICPTCRQDVVPIVRGVRSYCTACGGALPVLAAGEAVNVAGQPARLGAGIASVLGWLILAGGAFFALVFGLIASLIFPFSTVLWVGGGTFLFSLLFALPALAAGRSLRRAGESKVLATRERAVHALAVQHRGVLTVAGVARALEIPPADADALLTDLAKRPDGKVSLEVDEQGGITYVFRELALAQAAAAPRVRVGVEGWRVPAPSAEAQAPRIVDAELIDEEEAAADPARRQMRR